MNTSKTVRIGLAGFGNVGAGVYKHVIANRDLLAGRTGATLEITKIAVRDPAKARPISIPPAILTTDILSLAGDPEIDVIVELIGGTGAAKELVEAALKAHKPVVTGNKHLLAEHGIGLIALAEKENVPLYCEAAVAGGIPIIKAVREALVGNHILSIHGIINGTCNYILTRMADAGLAFADALKEAQDLGFAEADPTLDITGWDAAHKAIILAWLSYGRWIHPGEISVEGIAPVTAQDIAFAAQLGYAIKLVGVVRKSSDGAVEIRVGPSLLPKSHILSSVNGVFNAVAVRGDVVGETLFYGSGAGQDATSSAVIADLADAAANIAHGTRFEGFIPHGDYGSAVPVRDTISQYYLRLQVADKPGTVAKIAQVLADRNIGIRSFVQPGTAAPTGDAEIVLMTHDATFGNMRDALSEIASLEVTTGTPTLLRVERP